MSIAAESGGAAEGGVRRRLDGRAAVDLVGSSQPVLFPSCPFSPQVARLILLGLAFASRLGAQVKPPVPPEPLTAAEIVRLEKVEVEAKAADRGYDPTGLSANEAQLYEALQQADIDRLMAVWADDDEVPGGGSSDAAAPAPAPPASRGTTREWAHSTRTSTPW